LDVLSRADEQQEKGNNKCNEGDDGNEDIEDHSKRLETVFNISGLYNDDGTISQYVPDPIHDLSLLCCRNNRVQLDKTLLFWYVVCPFVICVLLKKPSFLYGNLLHSISI